MLKKLFVVSFVCLISNTVKCQTVEWLEKYGFIENDSILEWKINYMKFVGEEEWMVHAEELKNEFGEV